MEPVASLFHASWSWRRFYFAKFRLCNARRFQIGWLTVTVRAKPLWTSKSLAAKEAADAERYRKMVLEERLRSEPTQGEA